MDRSLIFTCLLDLSPEFGSLTTREGSEVISKVQVEWITSTETDMYDFVRTWLASHPIDAQEDHS